MNDHNLKTLALLIYQLDVITEEYENRKTHTKQYKKEVANELKEISYNLNAIEKEEYILSLERDIVKNETT